MAGATGGEKPIYGVGDLVFCQIRGYIPWPAILGKFNKNMWQVIFLATEDHSPIRLNKIWPYDSINKERFVTPRNLEYEAFAEAITEANLLVDDKNKRLKIAKSSYPDTNNNQETDADQEQQEQASGLNEEAGGSNQAAGGSNQAAGGSLEIADGLTQNATVANPQANQTEVVIVDEERIYAKNFMRQLLKQPMSIENELRFVEAMNAVNQNLKRPTPNIKNAIAALDHLRKQETSQLMLLRNLNCMNSIRDVCHFLEKPTEGMDPTTAVNKFAESIIVRYKAHKIYATYQSHFPNPYKKESFWEEYLYHRNIFQNYCANPNADVAQQKGSNELKNENSGSKDDYVLISSSSASSPSTPGYTISSDEN